MIGRSALVYTYANQKAKKDGISFILILC